ncbi:MAG TPA: hypothetical protein VKZ84_07870 [Bacteriovoracaceae bacterium]|nr:hypothetical protein [Bacteriovoracaceae bacterium]
MGKILAISTLMMLLVSCNAPEECNTGNTKQAQTSSCSTDSTSPPNEDTTPPIIDVGDVPSEAHLFNANVSLTNFNASQEEKVLRAIEMIKKIIRTKEFKERVINFTYNGQKRFVDNKGLSNEEIYQILIDGAETLLPEIDNEMDLDLELYTSNFTSTVGYTYPNVLRIWMNTKYFNAYSIAQVAGNVFHEWTHKLGFDHASSYSKSRDSSVPYGLGYIMVDLIDAELANPNSN